GADRARRAAPSALRDGFGLAIVLGALGATDAFVLVVGGAALFDAIGVRCPGAQVDLLAALRAERPPLVLGTIYRPPLADRAVERAAQRGLRLLKGCTTRGGSRPARRGAWAACCRPAK